MAKKKTMSDVDRYRQNLAALLESRQMTQAELAERSGVHFVTVSRVLSGNASPSLEMCEKLSTGAGTTTAKLLES